MMQYLRRSNHKELFSAGVRGSGTIDSVVQSFYSVRALWHFLEMLVKPN